MFIMKKNNLPNFFLMLFLFNFSQRSNRKLCLGSFRHRYNNFPHPSKSDIFIEIYYITGHLFGEKADLKIGITRFWIFIFISGAVVGVFIYLISIVVLWKNSKIWRHKPTEFFTMVSEYFFERPDLLKKKHPDLYRMLERCFNTSLRV